MPDVVIPSLEDLEAELAAIKTQVEATEEGRPELLTIDRRLGEIDKVLAEHRKRKEARGDA